MNKYEQLHNYIDDNEHIYCFSQEAVRGANVQKEGDDYAIFFNENSFATTTERRVALAHEVAHCQTGTVYSINTPKILKAQYERQAWKKTIKNLIPPEELTRVFETCVYAGTLDIYEAAEKLDVTVDLLEMAIKYYRDNGVRW